ncbi:MAG: histidine kinase [Actinobacteria bacterium]|nr:histidine kinase [Actinomycetota bacterium]
MLVLSAIVWLPVSQAQDDAAPAVVVLDLGLGLVAFVVVHFRRRWPMPVAVGLSLVGAVSGSAAGPIVLASVSVATARRWGQLLVVGVTSFAAAVFFGLVMPSGSSEPAWLILTFNAIATVGILGWGMYLGSRRELVASLQHRAERAEAEQELRAAQARTTERAQIAREMHDVLAHRISQISMHAGALSFRDDLSADEMRASATVIQEKAHEALTDLRGVLGVLRDEQTGELRHAPQPTYADLPALVAEAREGGLNIAYDDDVASPEQVPEAVGRTVYRIVQEGMTNARKHAPGALLSIHLTGGPDDGVEVLLSNPLGFGRSTTPGSGLGLVGLSERAGLRGGTLVHGTVGSAFELRGWLPWAP